MKTNKSLLKRVKITGSGKVIRRPRHDYFSSADHSGGTRHKRGYKHAPSELDRKVKALILT